MKYDNWRELAVECQESGMSVNAWSKKKKHSRDHLQTMAE